MHHVQAYIEYLNIVGDHDGGKLLSEEEYEKYKANAIELRKNRLYVSWQNTRTGLDCKQIGPSSKCFCGHLYRQHATDNVSDKHVHCTYQGCKCPLFDHIPVHGTSTIRCSCKHDYSDHNVTGQKPCHKANCTCKKFNSPMSCTCGDKMGVHRTVFETREERIAAGKPVDNLAGGGEGYAALGGITNFRSLVGNYEQMRQKEEEEENAEQLALTQQQQGPPRKLTQEEEFAIYEKNLKQSSSSAAKFKPRKQT